MPIIITAPHSKCVEVYVRDCDRRSSEAALIVKNILNESSSDDCTVSLHLSTLYRTNMDANRRESRNTKWRKKLASVTKENVLMGKTFVLDVHSFPPDSSFGHYKVYFLELQIPKELEYFDTTSSWSQEEKIASMRVIRKTLGIDGGAIITASSVNDIMLSSVEMGASSILLEVNESKEILGDEELKTFLTQFCKDVLLKYCK